MGLTLREEIEAELAEIADLREKNRALQSWIDYLVPPFDPAALLIEAGDLLHLTRVEALIVYRVSTPFGKVVTREAIVSLCEPNLRTDTLRNADSHVKRLRKKLSGSGIEIVTHYGIGYSARSDGSLALPWGPSGELAT